MWGLEGGSGERQTDQTRFPLLESQCPLWVAYTHPSQTHMHMRAHRVTFTFRAFFRIKRNNNISLSVQ